MLPNNSLATIRPINPEAFGPVKPMGALPMGGGQPPQQGGINAEKYLMNKVMELKRKGIGSGALGNIMASMPMQGAR